MSGQSLTVSNLSAGYARGEVLKSLSLPPCLSGTVTAIIGPNAAGKTTLLRAIAGLLPARGEARLGERNLVGLRPADLAGVVTYMPQALPHGVALTAIEAVVTALRVVPSERGLRACLKMRQGEAKTVISRTGAQRTFRFVSTGSAEIAVCSPPSRIYKQALSEAEIEAKAAAALDRLDVGHLALRQLDELSGGQRQLVSLAQAIVRRPAILLLDEPTSALDPRHQIDVMSAIHEIAAEDGMIVLVVLHDLNLALRWAASVALLVDGGILAAGAPQQAITPQTLERAYRIRARVEPCSQGRLQVIYDGKAG
ncbi:ABC transporter ATP-binding protein [Mesorhizobium australicum]|uniref:Iron complex transport system ATP-binding protein n=1 Tax=Mesorhizobium australicum TaxID=536018 RepID=A0A1X7NGE0_9HYPH|nr:ABC transporter ATP-binding protein [Mesorhizobium australicum]SMH36130.1 iron complex transport system ATP-binding protein [Mesorhizobium australicum]